MTRKIIRFYESKHALHAESFEKLKMGEIVKNHDFRIDFAISPKCIHWSKMFPHTSAVPRLLAVQMHSHATWQSLHSSHKSAKQISPSTHFHWTNPQSPSWINQPATTKATMITVTIMIMVQSSILLFPHFSNQSSLHSSHQCSWLRLPFHQHRRQFPQQLTVSSSIFINNGMPVMISFLSHHQQLTTSSSSTAAGDIAPFH